jgi:hypothetical protein
VAQALNTVVGIEAMRPPNQCLRVLANPPTVVLQNTVAKPVTPTTAIRRLASVSPSTPRRPQTTFTDALNSGPSLSDFLSSRASGELLSIPGTSHLPTWLKRPIPAGGSFAKIKQDLRGLNLHTGKHPTTHCHHHPKKDNMGLMQSKYVRVHDVQILEIVGVDQIKHRRRQR